MRLLVRCVAVMLAMMLCISTACAEIALVPRASEWDFSQPMDITVTAQVNAHMPLDEVRCGQLNDMLQHVSMKLSTFTGENESLGRMALLVDDQQAFALTARSHDGGSELRFSTEENVVFTADGDGLNAWFGLSAPVSLSYGKELMEGLEQAREMFCGMRDSLKEYGKTTSIKTAIKDMGTAWKKVFYTVPSSEAEFFRTAAMTHCPLGTWRTFLNELTFTGTQKLIFWLTSDDQVLRVEYAGNCETETSGLRKVSMIWRMRRDNIIRDDIVLKTPSVKGNDYNTLNFDREVISGKGGKVTLNMDLNYAWKLGQERDKLTATVDLTGQTKEEATTLSGKASFSRLMDDGKSESGLHIMPDLLIENAGSVPAISGTLGVQQFQGKNILEDAILSIQAGPGSAVPWEEPERTAAITSMTAEEKKAVSRRLSAELISRLVLLSDGHAAFLSADLSAEAWQRIVDAAQKRLGEEVSP